MNSTTLGRNRLVRSGSRLPAQRRKPRVVSTRAETVTPLTPPEDWLVWQLIDSAFPTGGFAHSAGLEAAWHHHEVRSRTELSVFVEASLQQLSRGALLFVLEAAAEPRRLAELDAICDAFTAHRVANRASRLQGRALLAAIERIIPESGPGLSAHAKSDPTAAATTTDAGFGLRYGHWAPVFGATMARLRVPRETAGRMFVFTHLRSVLAAAVRLNIIGPMEAQALHHRHGPRAADVLRAASRWGIEDLAQTAPLLELWQGTQDRLAWRLFQS